MSFPSYLQLDAMDCGPTSLKMIAQFYGKYYSIQNLRERCHISREGVSLLGISDAAESIGMRATGVKISWEQLRDEASLPCIVHWRHKHFIVIYKIRRIRKRWYVYVADPASGLLKYDETSFRKYWESCSCEENDGCQETVSNKMAKGIALLLEPTPLFYEEIGEENRKLHLGYVLQYLRPYKGYIVQLCLAMITASVISLIVPFLTQSVVDIGIGTNNLSFVVVILIAQFVLVLGQLANNLIRSWLMLHMTTRISVSLISDFLAKLMRLPISFFDSKKIGDIMQRIGDHNRIQLFLTSSVLSMVMAIAACVIYSIVMGCYNASIFWVFLIGSILYVGWILLFMKHRRRLDYMRFQEAASNQSNIVQLISGMQEIKLNNCEKQKRWEWENIQAKLFKVSIKGLTLGQTQEIGGTFIEQAKNIIITFIAASSVVEGDMSLGMMVSLQFIIGQLNAPLLQFISFVQVTQDAKISLERLSEIQKIDDEEPEQEYKIREIPECCDIEFKGVTFQYNGPYSTKALDEVNIVIPSNKVTAIVGTSGSGKTTMLKMMLGFYNPTHGEIILNGKKISDYSPSCWRKACGTVMQDGYIFSDTIANNIAITDDMPDMDRVRHAAFIANIDAFIKELPQGYNTQIGADGQGLSTGQKQRLLIARAAYKNAKFLFLDEATNSLDANNEQIIMEHLDALFKNKTVIVVAHRLSTVKNADKIVVLNQGRVVEEGIHNELILQKGYYYELVKNQLELGN